jgi:biopolymer transport protein TolR
MKLSRRAKRMQSHHARKKDRNAGLNMISLMDIFTILVFFLLVNATSSEVLPTPKKITLPNSVADQIPRRNLVISVNKESINLEGIPVVKVKSVSNPEQKTIPALFKSLKTTVATVKDLTDKKGVTIMADREIPYALLKKIMLTCQGAGFSNLSFAVNQTSAEVEG